MWGPCWGGSRRASRDPEASRLYAAAYSRPCAALGQNPAFGRGRAGGGRAPILRGCPRPQTPLPASYAAIPALSPSPGRELYLFAFYRVLVAALDRKSTRLNSSHVKISYAVFCLK